MTTAIFDDYLGVWIDAFLKAKRAGGMAQNTILFYSRKLKQFNEYCEGQAVKQVQQIDAPLLREFILWMQQDHNEGGVHAAYRAVRAFLRWYEAETDERTAIDKVKPPRMTQEPIEGVSIADVLAMVKACNRGSFTGDRDAAILLCLLDTGCRAREFLSIDLADVDQVTGEILVRRTKGNRPRYVYLGQVARKALRRYLKHRQDTSPALWVSNDNERLAYSSLRGIMARRARDAGIQVPALHSFRRAFALNYLRNGGDVFTLQKLMGHSDLSVLRQYLKLTDQDLQTAHAKFSPIDRQ